MGPGLLLWRGPGRWQARPNLRMQAGGSHVDVPGCDSLAHVGYLNAGFASHASEIRGGGLSSFVERRHFLLLKVATCNSESVSVQPCTLLPFGRVSSILPLLVESSKHFSLASRSCTLLLTAQHDPLYRKALKRHENSQANPLAIYHV